MSADDVQVMATLPEALKLLRAACGPEAADKCWHNLGVTPMPSGVDTWWIYDHTVKFPVFTLLMDGFIWGESPEGDHYWSHTNEKYLVYLKEWFGEKV